MRIGFVGAGKLGLPVAISVAHKGHDVMVYDINGDIKQYVDGQQLPYKESGPDGTGNINSLFKKINIKWGSVEEIVKHSELIFVAVQTPHDPMYEGTTRLSKQEKDFDYTWLISACKNLFDIINLLNEKRSVVIISTVLPGTLRRDILPLRGTNVSLSYSPQFIAMGTVVRDYLNPEFNLFGKIDDDAAALAKTFYTTINSAPFVEMSLESAELTKVAYNVMIGQKITFANQIMEVCHKLGFANADDVMNCLKLSKDRLISPRYLSPGMGDSGGCLLPEGIIYTEQGPKEIQDIEQGERVLSYDGKLHNVIETYKRPYKGPIYKIKVRGLPPEYFTPEHPVVSSLDQRKKYHLKDGSEKTYNRKKLEYTLGDLQEVKVRDLTEDHYLVFPKPIENNTQSPNYANRDYIRLAGYYLAEGTMDGFKRKNGTTKYGRVSWYFHMEEKEFLNDVCSSIKALYPDSNPQIKTKRGSKCSYIRFSKVDLADKLLNDFGRGSSEKSIPNWILYGALNNAKELLRGLWRGDGSTHTGGFNYSTVSINLAYGVSFLLRKFDIPNAIQYYVPRTGNDGVYHRESWEVRVRNAQDLEKLSELVEMPICHQMQEKQYTTIPLVNNLYYHKVESIEIEQYEGTVWNLNVEEQHKYITNIGAVYNCHPRDSIALSWLSETLNLKYNMFSNLMVCRELQTEFLADVIEEHHKKSGLPIMIYGYTYKPETNLTTGSCSILLKNILEERGLKVDMFDPYVSGFYLNWKDPSLYFIGMNHADFIEEKFPKGSVVLDPWGFMPHKDGTLTIRIGRNK